MAENHKTKQIYILQILLLKWIWMALLLLNIRVDEWIVILRHSILTQYCEIGGHLEIFIICPFLCCKIYNTYYNPFKAFVNWNIWNLMWKQVRKWDKRFNLNCDQSRTLPCWILNGLHTCFSFVRENKREENIKVALRNLIYWNSLTKSLTICLKLAEGWSSSDVVNICAYFFFGQTSTTIKVLKLGWQKVLVFTTRPTAAVHEKCLKSRRHCCSTSRSFLSDI